MLDDINRYIIVIIDNIDFNDGSSPSDLCHAVQEKDMKVTGTCKKCQNI